MRVRRLTRHDYRVTGRDVVDGHMRQLQFTVTDQVYQQHVNAYGAPQPITGTIYETLKRLASADGLK